MDRLRFTDRNAHLFGRAIEDEGLLRLVKIEEAFSIVRMGKERG